MKQKKKNQSSSVVADRAGQLYLAHRPKSRPRRAADLKRLLYSSVTNSLVMMLYKTLCNKSTIYFNATKYENDVFT